MQTFLPYPDYKQSALVLDRKRLGKQRVEAYQIRIFLEERKDGEDLHGFHYHPCVKMWEGHEDQLFLYTVEVIAEWDSRGYNDSILSKWIGRFYEVDVDTAYEWALDSEKPPWLGNPRLHRTHRSNLVRKDPEYYGSIFTGTQPGLDYWWPEQDNEGVG